MKKCTFSVIGTKPFLYHKFNIEAITDTKKPKEGSSGNQPSEWKKTIWNEGKRLFVPGFYFLSAFTTAGKYVKIGRGTISKQVASAVTILDERVYFNRELPDELDNLDNNNISKDSSSPVYLDIRAVSNPNTKGKNIRYRLALSPGWEFEVAFMWDDSIISADQMKSTVEALGKLVGFSEGRTIGYGRFEITEWSVSKA